MTPVVVTLAAAKGIGSSEALPIAHINLREVRADDPFEGFAEGAFGFVAERQGDNRNGIARIRQPVPGPQHSPAASNIPYVPNTQLPSIAFRSELIHEAA